jgi:hypothetical protein
VERDATSASQSRLYIYLGPAIEKFGDATGTSMFTFLMASWIVSVLVVIPMRPSRSAKNARSRFVTLNLPSVTPVVRKSLCTGCIFSPIVRGFEPLEERILCVFAFPLRKISFAVRECIDFRPEREAFATLKTAQET